MNAFTERPSIAGIEILPIRLNDYFDFHSPDDIRLKGTRVGIETVLYDYIHRHRTPEEIVSSYPTLELEQIHAAILLYLHHQQAVNRYLENWIEQGRQSRAEQQCHPIPVSEKMQQLRAERATARQEMSA